MVNFVSSSNNLALHLSIALGIEDVVALDGIIKDATLGDFLGLEALVLREVLSVIVSQMVV